MGDDRARDAVEDLRAAVTEPFERARAMPKSVYIGPDFFALEMERISVGSGSAPGGPKRCPRRATT